MTERNAQSFDLDKHLSMLEAWIRNDIPIDIPDSVKDSIDHYEAITADERKIFLGHTISMAGKRSEYFGSQLAWAVLRGVGERFLERNKKPPKQLALFGLAVLTGRIREKRERGRPPRSVVQEKSIVSAYDIMTNYKGYTAGEAREKIASWMCTKPSEVAKILRAQDPDEMRPFSKK